MTHSVLPEDTTEHLYIPFVASFDYDISVIHGFRTFPRQCGLTSAKEDIDLNKPLEELASLTQSWLYFGLASEFAGKNLEPKQFLARSDLCLGRQVADVMVRQSIYSLLYERWESLGVNGIQELKETIQYAESQCNIFDCVSAPLDSNFAAVTLSVRLLIEYLRIIVRTRDQRFLPLAEQYPSGTSLSAQVLLARMQSRGRCPRRMRIVCSTFDFTTLYFIASLNSLRGPARHEHCSEDECRWVAPETNSFGVTHRQEICNCLCVGPSMAKIAQIIQTGGVPLIKICEEPNGRIKLGVVRCSPSTQYTAISHAWADRQLCAKNNSLPQCQLEHLKKLLSRLTPDSERTFHAHDLLQRGYSLKRWQWRKQSEPANEGLFWLDTLCIPTNVEHKHLRLAGINMMDRIYSGASQVLVFDSELQHLEAHYEHILTTNDDLFGRSAGVASIKVPERSQLNKLLTHTLCCNWMSRMWTLQEGVLARNCVFQLGDSVVEAQHMDFRRYYVSDTKREQCEFLTRKPTILYFWKRVRAWQSKVHANRFYISSVLGAIALCVSGLLTVAGCWWAGLLLRTSQERSFKYLVGRCEPDSSAEFISQDLRNALSEALDPKIFNFDGYSREQQFMKIWNALLVRVTSKPEDLHIIIANLLGFDARFFEHIKDPGGRMRMILLNMSRLPHELLYLDTPKYHAGADNPDRWIPLAPGDRPLTGVDMMQLSEHGFIITHALTSQNTIVKIEAGALRASKICLSFAMMDSNNTSLSGVSLHDDKIWIECLLPENDELSATATGETYFMFEGNLQVSSRTANSVQRGARLLFSKETSTEANGSKEIFLRYDCAVRATTSPYAPSSWNTSSEPEIPVFRMRRVAPGCTFVLEHSSTSLDVPLPCRAVNPQYRSLPYANLRNQFRASISKVPKILLSLGLMIALLLVLGVLLFVVIIQLVGIRILCGSFYTSKTLVAYSLMAVSCTLYFLWISLPIPYFLYICFRDMLRWMEYRSWYTTLEQSYSSKDKAVAESKELLEQGE